MSRNEIPIDQRRGLHIGDLGYSARFYFVEAPVEQVAGLYAEQTNATSWERDVCSRCRQIDERGTLFYQLKGHRWTGAEDLHDHPRTFSQRLNCKVVELSFQKTVSATSYLMFDRGERVEVLSVRSRWGATFRVPSARGRFLALERPIRHERPMAVRPGLLHRRDF